MQIEKVFDPGNDDLAELNRRFHEFTQSQLPGLPAESEDKKFLFTIKKADRLVAGISGAVYWNGLDIDTLWVEESQRGNGIGQQLLTEAENYACQNNAVIAFLKTLGAVGFYQKAGYEVYGVLEDRPLGTQLFHMKKRLD
ncbi:MAG: ribosomal protein S18 acetylase RimI-like enzyme [Gammaproteobacteria bacterium]|jgi:ribosomal protein S18 acetylase RimI-like enzyme